MSECVERERGRKLKCKYLNTVPLLWILLVGRWDCYNRSFYEHVEHIA